MPPDDDPPAELSSPPVLSNDVVVASVVTPSAVASVPGPLVDALAVVTALAGSVLPGAVVSAPELEPSVPSTLVSTAAGHPASKNKPIGTANRVMPPLDGEGVAGFSTFEDPRWLVDMNLRHYDPQTRRSISPDPVVAGVYDTQAWNRYAYVRNNPLRWVDPTGAYGKSPYGGGMTLTASTASARSRASIASAIPLASPSSRSSFIPSA